MKKIMIFLLLYFLLFNLAVISQNQFDTLSIRQIAKGVQHISIVEPYVPWTIDVLKIDLEKSILKIEAGISHNRITGFEKTSAISSRSNSDGHHIVGAINGGFFDGTGRDVGMQIREGEIVTSNNNWSAIGFSLNKIPFIERLSLQSKIILSDNINSRIINGINKSRDENQLILYNSYFGSSTTTNQYGSEVMVEPISNWMVNDTNACIVINKNVAQGNMALVEGRAILSGHGFSKDFIDSNIEVGDTIFVIHKISPAPEQVTTLLNGYPKIVSNGENCALACYADEGGSNTFATARHPRTAAGFGESKRYLYLATVDGRQVTSKGMSLPEFADFLISIGVYRAVNLDGGGSTTMVVRNKIVNSPSDAGGERRVSNSLMVVSLDSKGELTQINLNTEYAKVFAKRNYQFSVSGSDEYYNSISINNSNVHYSLSHNFGAITNSGLFTAGEKADSGFVISEYESMKDSALVIVNSIVRLEITPKLALADTVNEIQFSVKSYDITGWNQNLSNDNFKWYSTNSDVGIIDSLGKFTGLSGGTTKIIVEWGDVSDTAIVSIELKEGTSILNSFNNIDEWSLSGKDIDTINSSIEIINTKFTEGNSSLKLNYSFTYQSGVQNWAYLNADIPIEGIPLSFEIDINANDFSHSIAFIVSNYSEEEFAILTDKPPDIDEQFDTLTAKFDNPIPLEPNIIFHFPIVIKQIAIILSSNRVSNTTYTGSILFDNLRANYSETPVSVKLFNKSINSFTLYQNYPNPFNPTTTIRYSIHTIEKNNRLNLQRSEMSKVKITIFDILGRTIATLVDKYQKTGSYDINFDASKLASGVYYYTLTMDNLIESKKMILLR
ncbi:MAG: phosphodiester glycosidase family protein [Melioribacteraceae bacterium]|nr:phosphodiester glycosidase family protein [Melioribacteraceae bacterium]